MFAVVNMLTNAGELADHHWKPKWEKVLFNFEHVLYLYPTKIPAYTEPVTTVVFAKGSEITIRESFEWARLALTHG